ncbi:MAG: LicD family protein [Atopobiaceae bacterium]|nr:LicD family protein [Atopobiaceae bacterium]
MQTPAVYEQSVLERLQAVILDILVAIDQICRDNNLTYFLDGGTLLGAVRHEGFIPWDDDVDISMPYEDYFRFIEIAPNALPKGLSLHRADNTSGMTALWTKVYKDGTRFIDSDNYQAGCNQGIFVDVFPFIRLENGDRAARNQHRKAVMWQSLSYLHHISRPTWVDRGGSAKVYGTLFKLAHASVARPWKPATLLQKYETAINTRNPGNYWTNPSWLKLIRLPDNAILPARELKFEGAYFYAPQDPDVCLREHYGDYMKLPEPEKRHTHTPLVLDFGDGINVVSS